MRETTRRLARRELLLGGFTFLMAVIGLASPIAVAIADAGSGLRVPGADAGGAEAGGAATLVAVGSGEARIAAETASVQILLGPADGDVMISGGGAIETGDGDPLEARREAAQPMVQAIRAAGAAPSDVTALVSPVFDAVHYGPDDGPFGVRIDVTITSVLPRRSNGP